MEKFLGMKHTSGAQKSVPSGAQSVLSHQIDSASAASREGSDTEKIPLLSSAAVERLLSFGSDILRPKRSALSSHNFEQLVLKGNLKIIEKIQQV